MYIGIIAPTLERKHSPTKQRFELYHHVNTLTETIQKSQTGQDRDRDRDKNTSRGVRKSTKWNNAVLECCQRHNQKQPTHTNPHQPTHTHTHIVELLSSED